MDALVLLAIASLALWMGAAIVGAQLLRRRRRRDMGLPPLTEKKDFLDRDLGRGMPLPHREKDWRNDSSVYWTTPRYYGGARRRLQEETRRRP